MNIDVAHLQFAHLQRVRLAHQTVLERQWQVDTLERHPQTQRGEVQRGRGAPSPARAGAVTGAP